MLLPFFGIHRDVLFVIPVLEQVIPQVIYHPPAFPQFDASLLDVENRDASAEGS